MDYVFDKPQAFHSSLVSRRGGLAAIISFSIFFIFNFFMFEIVYSDYIYLSFTMFLGFIEDVKFETKPIYRLIMMVFFLLFFIIYFSIKIDFIDLNFLSIWFQNKIFSISFILLCFLFIINGSNLIDGFNGLAGGTLIIMFSFFSLVGWIAADLIVINVSILFIMVLNFFLS